MCPFFRHRELFDSFLYAPRMPIQNCYTSYTPLKLNNLNMSLKRGPFQKDISSSNHSLKGIFVSFQGCNIVCLKFDVFGAS